MKARKQHFERNSRRESVGRNVLSILCYGTFRMLFGASAIISRSDFDG
jgi:hypothetical protein